MSIKHGTCWTVRRYFWRDTVWFGASHHTEHFGIGPKCWKMPNFRHFGPFFWWKMPKNVEFCSEKLLKNLGPVICRTELCRMPKSLKCSMFNARLTHSEKGGNNFCYATYFNKIKGSNTSYEISEINNVLRQFTFLQQLKW